MRCLNGLWALIMTAAVSHAAAAPLSPPVVVLPQDDPRTDAAIRLLLEQPEAVGAEGYRQLSRFFRDCAIERLSWPHPTPGIDAALSGNAGLLGAGPKQLELQRVYYEHVLSGTTPIADAYRTFAIDGGNRAGKTAAVWGMCALWAIRDYAQDGDRYWCISSDFKKSVSEAQQWVWEWLPRRMFLDQQYNAVTGFGMHQRVRLTLDDGRGHCLVEFWTEEQELVKFESSGATRGKVCGVIWSEATREAVYDAVKARLVDRNGWMMIDYLDRAAWHRTRLKANTAVYTQRYTMLDNQHNLPAGAVAKASQEMSPEEVRWRVHGIGRTSQGLVFAEYVDERYKPVPPDAMGLIDIDLETIGHLLPPMVIPDEWPTWVRLDPGKYTACLLYTMDPGGRLVVADEVYELAATIQYVSDRVKAMLARHNREIDDVRGYLMDPEELMATAESVWESRRRTVGTRRAPTVQEVRAQIQRKVEAGGGAWQMDPAGFAYAAGNPHGRTLAAEYRSQGLPFTAWTPTHVMGESAQIDVMRHRLHHRTLLVCENCRHLREELMSWSHREDRDGKVDPREAYTGHNHAIDCTKAFVASDPSKRRTVSAYRKGIA